MPHSPAKSLVALLDGGADPNGTIVRGVGYTLIDFAARQGRTDLVLRMADAGARCESVAFTAASKGNRRLLEGLASKGRADLGDEYLIHHASRGGHVETVRWLLGLRPPEYQKTAASYLLASESTNLAMVELLLAHGANPSYRHQSGDYDFALLNAARGGSLPVVRRLLEAGANPNVRQSGGWTPLHAAAANGDLASVDLLLDAGADPTATNDEGRSVRDLATESGDAATADRIRSKAQTAP